MLVLNYFMKVVVFHRALGTPKDDWYPWLEKKLGWH